MLSVKRILVPVDFSPGSKAALNYAGFLAEKFEGEVAALHIWAPPRFVVREAKIDIPGRPSLTLEEYARGEAAREMEIFIEDISETTNVRPQGHLVCGDPLDEILVFASNERQDLIIMGTHGRTGLSHFFLGSVAESVVRHAECPVITIRFDQEGHAVIDD